MAPVTIYHKPTCTKSRETKKMLDAAGVDYDTTLYIEDPPSLEALRRIADDLQGFTVRDMLREKEAKAEGWDPETQGSDEDILAFLAAHPVALQRPIVVAEDGRAAIGRPPAKVAELLGIQQEA